MTLSLRKSVLEPTVPSGRFMQEDLHQGMRANPASIVNKYSYTENNPIIFTDSKGLSKWLDNTISEVAKYTDKKFQKAANFANEAILKKFGVKISAAQFTRVVVIGTAGLGLFVGFSTGNPHLAAASGAVLVYNLHNWKKDGSPSDIIWNSAKMGAAGFVGAEVALIAGPLGGLLVMPTTYGTARLLGFEGSDAMAGATGATVGFGIGTWKDSTPSGGDGGTPLKGGKFNDAGTWVPE